MNTFPKCNIINIDLPLEQNINQVINNLKAEHTRHPHPSQIALAGWLLHDMHEEESILNIMQGLKNGMQIIASTEPSHNTNITMRCMSQLYDMLHQAVQYRVVAIY